MEEEGIMMRVSGCLMAWWRSKKWKCAKDGELQRLRSWCMNGCVEGEEKQEEEEEPVVSGIIRMFCSSSMCF
jgi:hypothetical protein